MSTTELPSGYSVRRATVEDASEIADLENGSNLAEVGFEWTSPDQVRDLLTSPGHDPDDDLLLVAGDGSLAGHLTLWADEPVTVVHQLTFVRPSLWGQGLSAWLLRAGEERARAKAGDLDAVLRVSRWATNEAAATLFASLGYRYVRTFRTLRMELDEVPPARAPDGVAIRTFDRGSDTHAVHAALAEAFADHWGTFGFPPFDEWVHEAIEGRASAFDPSLWFVASDGDEVAGAVCARHGTARDAAIGQIDYLGVRRAWRGRGIGTALLLSAFGALAARGVPEVELGVDSDSPTGARRLYEGVGMQTAYAYEVWEKELR